MQRSPQHSSGSPYRARGGERGLSFDFTGVIGLCLLVEHEQPGYGPVVADEVAMQGQVGDQMCADPVPGAADPSQWRRALGGVGHDGEPVDVQADSFAVLEGEFLGPLGHVPAQGCQP